jgi:hypothetical protein
MSNFPLSPGKENIPGMQQNRDLTKAQKKNKQRGIKRAEKKIPNPDSVKNTISQKELSKVQQLQLLQPHNTPSEKPHKHIVPTEIADNLYLTSPVNQEIPASIDTFKEELCSNFDTNMPGYFNIDSDASKMKIYLSKSDTFIIRPSTNKKSIAEIDILKIIHSDSHGSYHISSNAYQYEDYKIETHTINYDQKDKKCYLDNYSKNKFNTIRKLEDYFKKLSLSPVQSLLNLPVSFKHPLIHTHTLSRAQQLRHTMMFNSVLLKRRKPETSEITQTLERGLAFIKNEIQQENDKVVIKMFKACKTIAQVEETYKRLREGYDLSCTKIFLERNLSKEQIK